MTIRKCLAISGIILLGQLSFAKSGDQLMSEMANLLPPGKKLHLAWSQGSPNSSIYVVDSDDGIIRELTPASLFTNGRRHITVPFITPDGRRVAFVEELSYFVYVIDWNGSNLRKLFDSGCIGAAWQHPDSLTQWIIMDLNGSSLVNIDNMAQRVKIWSGGMCALGDNDGFGISVDGKRIGGFLCASGSGIASTPAGAPVCNSCGGCNFAMRPTAGAYEYCHFATGHASIHIHNADGSLKQDADISSTVSSWASSHISITEGQPSNLKWTNDPDYVVYHWGNWAVNPILFRLSDKSWVGIRDDLTNAAVGNIDGVFLSQGSGIHKPISGAKFGSSSTAKPGSLFTLTGRRIESVQNNRNCGQAGVRWGAVVEVFTDGNTNEIARRMDLR